jgi:multicomponent Na+:H+ antiporter subunit F
MYIFLFLIIFSAIIIGMFRFIKGPTSSDRVMALDTLTTVISSLLVLSALYFKRYILLDISFVFAALSFTSIIVISRYLEGRS